MKNSYRKFYCRWKKIVGKNCWRNIFRKKPRLDPRRVKGLPYSPAPSRDQAPVHLDVGGKQFTTSLSTLTSVPGSKIFDLFTGRLATVLDMKTNSYFIDRDGELFRFVLQFLRDGTLAVPDNFQVISLDHCKDFKFFQGMGTTRKGSGFLEFIWVKKTHKIKGRVIIRSIMNGYIIFSWLNLFDIFHIYFHITILIFVNCTIRLML